MQSMLIVSSDEDTHKEAYSFQILHKVLATSVGIYIVINFYSEEYLIYLIYLIYFSKGTTMVNTGRKYVLSTKFIESNRCSKFT